MYIHTYMVCICIYYVDIYTNYNMLQITEYIIQFVYHPYFLSFMNLK